MASAILTTLVSYLVRQAYRVVHKLAEKRVVVGVAGVGCEMNRWIKLGGSYGRIQSCLPLKNA